MSVQAIDAAPAQRCTLPLWVGLIVYAVLLSAGNRLLIDPDTFWQVAVGQWMVDHRTVPMIDRKSTRLNSSHIQKSRMPSSA